MTDIFDSSWSQTDSSNTSMTPGPGFPEGQPPSSLNNMMRAFQGAVKRTWCWDHATVTSAGTASAQTLTYSVAPQSLAAGITFKFVCGFDVTGPTSLNVNELGAINIFANGAPLLGGEMRNGIIAIVSYDGTNFQLENPLPKMRLLSPSTNIIYCDGTAGSDTTGDGTAGNPYQSIQFAYDWIIDNVDAGGGTIAISQTGVDTQGLLCDYPVTGAPFIRLILNGSIATSNSAAITLIHQGSLFLQGNGTISATNFGCVSQCEGPFYITGVTFGAVSNSHVYAQGGKIVMGGDYSISGNAGKHLAVDSAGNITYYPEIVGTTSITVTLDGTRAFSDTFVSAAQNGSVTCDHTFVMFDGSATGLRYFASTNSNLGTNGAGPNFFPGSSAGILDSSTYGSYA